MLARLREAMHDDETGRYGVVPTWIRLAGLVWLGLSLPVITATAFFVNTSDQYLFVLVFMASGAYTTPGLVASWYAARSAPGRDRFAYTMLFIGLVSIFLIGVGILIGLATGWNWGNYVGLPAVAVSGIAHSLGVMTLVRSRSGGRALSVDVLEAVAAVLAVIAPLVVLWGPAVVDSDVAWFTVPAAVTFLFALWCAYWGVMLVVRLGPGRGAFEYCVLGLLVSAVANALVQTIQGTTDFALPVPPLIALHAVNMSMYLFIPLNVPWLVRKGLDRLPPQGQIRGARVPTVLSLTGTVVLLVTTALVADDRPWVTPFALGVVASLVLVGGMRQMAAVGETRRLYRQVEEASEERRRLVAQLLERSVDDRRNFASRLYEQAIAAYTSFRALARADNESGGSHGGAGEATTLVGNDLVRRAESVRELMLALRPIDGGTHRPQRLATPITAYLSSIYEDRPAPQLEVEIAEGLTLDWVTETMALQIVRQALHNIWRHSNASTVYLALELTDDNIVVLRIADDGDGFDVASATEGSGIAGMRTSAAVIGSSLNVESQPGRGTTVTVRIGDEVQSVDGPGEAGLDWQDSPVDQVEPERPGRSYHLRLVPGLAADAD
jgi:signal transduction histidine kinase